MKLYFLRHAESVNNPKETVLITGIDMDTPLSSQGEQQAKHLADSLRLMPIHFDATYVSPTVRTRQTLAILDAAPSIARSPHVIDERLIELSQGTAEGKPREQVYTSSVIQQRHTRGKDFAFPNGESMNAAAYRLEQWIADIRQNFDEHASILAVSHAMLLRSYVSCLNDWTMQQTLENTLENCHFIELNVPTKGPAVVTCFNNAMIQSAKETTTLRRSSLSL